MIDYRAEPERRRRRRINVAAAATAALITAGVYGLSISGTSLPLFASLPDTTGTPPLIPDIELLEEIAGNDSGTTREHEEPIVPGPVDEEDAGLTVGERLKRLDSLMVHIPADSLEGLMAEYEQLLDSALSVRYSERGRPSYARDRSTSAPRSNALTATDTPRPDGDLRTNPSPAVDQVSPPPSRPSERNSTHAATTTNADPRSEVVQQTPSTPSESVTEVPTPPIRQRSNERTVRSTPRSSLRTNNSLSGTQPEGVTTEPRSTASTSTPSSTPKSSPQPTTSQRSNSGVANSTASTHQGRVRNVESDGSQRRVNRRQRMAENEHRAGVHRPPSRAHRRGRTSSPEGSGRTRTSQESVEHRYTEGLAQFRAGHFSRALELLRPVAAGRSTFHNVARYYVAVSMERTGNLKGALKNYRSLKGVSGSIGEKSWIASARLMSSLGQNSAALRELREFTSRRSQSRYLPQARQLIEGLK